MGVKFDSISDEELNLMILEIKVSDQKEVVGDILDRLDDEFKKQYRLEDERDKAAVEFTEKRAAIYYGRN